MFSLRIVTVDSYQSSPISGYDDCYSDFRGCEISNVPVLTLFGTTQAGQKGAVHIHGVFPYLYLRWKDVFPGVSTANCRKYLQELALEIDKALNVEAAKSNSNKHHVHNITIEKKRPIYGFYPEAEDFLKILFYCPWDTSRVAALLYRRSILDKFIQPYEAHFPYGFQFFVDYNLFGMNTININAFKFRSPDVVDAPTSSTPRNISSFLSGDSLSYCQIWNVASLSSSQVNNIPKRVVSELEVDCREDAILNKYGLMSCSGRNPGLVEIKDNLAQQRRLVNETSQMTPIPTQERDVEVTASELFYKRLLTKIIERRKAAEESLINENDEFNANNDSQRSFIQSSSESFGLSSTQDKEVLKMLVNMCKSHGPEDDSILATHNDSESDDDDDEVTNEMSQQFVDDILQTQWSSENIDSQNQIHSGNVFQHSMDSGSQQSIQIPQVDGAYDDDDESFENGPKLLKQENVNVNTEFNEEPPVLHPIHPLESFDQDWTTHCSVKVTDIGTVDSSRPIPLAFLANARNVQPKSKKLHVPVVNKSRFSEMIQNKQVQRKSRTVHPSVENLVSDLISKVAEQEDISVISDSKANNNQIDSKPSSSKSDKTSKPNADCFLGARPKAKSSIHSLLKKSSGMKYLSVDKVSTNNLESLSTKSCNNLVEQIKLNNSSSMIPSSLKHSTDHKSKVKKKNHGLYPSSLNEKSSKESTSLKEMKTGADYNSKKKDNHKQNEQLSDSSKLKKSSSNYSEFHASPSTKSSDSEQNFDVVKNIRSVNFAKVGCEAVLVERLTNEKIAISILGHTETAQNVVKKLTDEEIAELILKHTETTQNVHLISEEISTESKKGQKGLKDDKKQYKMFDRNKLKSASPNQVDNLDLKESFKINSDSAIYKELLLSEGHSGSIKHSTKCLAGNDHSSLQQVLSKKSILDSYSSKKFKNNFHGLDNTSGVFCPSKSSDEKLSTFSESERHASPDKGMFLSQDDAHSSRVKATSGHQCIVPSTNAKKLDNSIDFKNVFETDVGIPENIAKSPQPSDSSLATGAFTPSLKPKFPKSAKNVDCKVNSKHKRSKKDKNSAKCRKKKAKSMQSSEKNSKHLECDKDFKQDSKASFKNTLHGKVSYDPKAIVINPGSKPLFDSDFKIPSSKPNLHNKVTKTKKLCPSPKVIDLNKMDKIKQLLEGIMEKGHYGPFVQLTDCIQLIEKCYPKNLPLLLKKKVSLQCKGNNQNSCSKAFSELENNKYHASGKGHISGSSCSNKNRIKRLTNKPKYSEFVSDPLSKGKNQGYPKLNVFSLPAQSDVDVLHPEKSSHSLPFPGKYKSDMNLKLEAQSTSSNILKTKTESQDILPFAVKSKPTRKSKSLTDLYSSNELSSSYVNQTIKTSKSNGKNNLLVNNSSNGSPLIKTPNEATEETSSSKSADSTFLHGALNHTKKLSSNKNSKFKFNNCKSADPDCIIVEEVNTDKTSKNKMSYEPKVNLSREAKNKTFSQCIANKDNVFKSPLANPLLKNDSNFKPKILLKNEQNDTVLEKTAELKPSRESHKPKLPSSNSLDTGINIINDDLYDKVKRRTASKTQIDLKSSLKPDSSKLLDNKKPGKIFPTSSKTKTSKKNLITSQIDLKSVPNIKSELNVIACEKEKSLCLSEGKAQICVFDDTTAPNVENSSTFKAGKLLSCPNKNQCRTKQETVLIANNMITDSTSLTFPPKIAKDASSQCTESEQKSPGSSTSSEFLNSNIPFARTTLDPIPESSNENHLDILPHAIPALGSSLNISSKSILSKTSKGRACKMSGMSNNFGFFSSKTPQRSRRCQNDPESLQFSKPNRLSLKLNRKKDSSNEKKDNASQQDLSKEWKVESILLKKGNLQGCSKLDSSETNSTPAETYVLPKNIKTEPIDDYENNHKNSEISDALKCFDFDESSSSDPASYIFSPSKRTQTRKSQQRTHQSKPGINAAKTTNGAHGSLNGFIEADKRDFHRNTSSISTRNNHINDRYPKRHSSTDDEVIILKETKGTGQGRRCQRLTVSDKPAEVVDLEPEETESTKITIKCDSKGHRSVVPNKTCTSIPNNTSRPKDVAGVETSYSKCDNAPDALGSMEDLSGQDSKNGLKLRLKVKTISTRNSGSKLVYMGKLDGENVQESDSNVHDYSNVTVKTEAELEIKSSKTKRTLGVRNSKRKSNAITDAPYVPPLPKIKIEKKDDYENPCVQPWDQSSKITTQTNRSSRSCEQKVETLTITKNSKSYCIKSEGSNKRKLPNVTEESSNNGTEKKRPRGRPRKSLKDVPSNENLSDIRSAYQIPKTSPTSYLSDIDGQHSFSVPSITKVGPDKQFPWVTIKVEKKDSSQEDASIVDNKVNVNNTPVLDNNTCAKNLRSNKPSIYSNYKGLDDVSDEETISKQKKGPKPQRKKVRCKSDNTYSNWKPVKIPNEISPSKRKLRAGSFKNYLNGNKGGNSSDSDCKVVDFKPKKSGRGRGRPKKIPVSETLPSCKTCSVTIERLSPSLLKQGSSSEKPRRMSNVETSDMPNINSARRNSIQIASDLNSNIATSYSTQNNRSTVLIPPSVNDITIMNQPELNSDKSDFEVLHNKVIGKKISPVLQPSPIENPCTKFIPDSGPVTINGLNSIDIDSNFSELLCEEEMSGNKLNCSSFIYSSSLNPDGNILSNQNPVNFLRPPSHEMDQRVFESPSNILKSGSMDCQSPLLYSHSPVTDTKHISEFSPDNKFLHLNHSSPQSYKRQQEFIHSPIMNSDPIFDHCNSPINEVIIANNKNEALKTPEKDFSQVMQQRDASTYYSNHSDSYKEDCRTDCSVIPKSKTKGNVLVNVGSGIPEPLCTNDFSKGPQHSYSFDNSVDRHGELAFNSTKELGNYDKISNNQHDSLKYLDSNFSGRKDSMVSCFPNNYSKNRKQLSSIPEQTGSICKESNLDNSQYSQFPSNYGSPIEVQQSQPYSTCNQNSFSNSFPRRTDESLNSFGNQNEYYDRRKWEGLNYSNTNDSYPEDCKSPFSAQKSRYDGYYSKNTNDLNRSSRINRDPYCRQKWSEVNTAYFPPGERPHNEFSQNDRSLDEFSLHDRSANETFGCHPPEYESESNKYTNSYPIITSQVSSSNDISTSNGAKSVHMNLSHFPTFDCNSKDTKEFHNTMEKKFENTFDKSIDAFLDHNGFPASSPEIQSPSPVSHASPQLGSNSSPFKGDTKNIFDKNMDLNSESKAAGHKYTEVCKPSPCSSLSDHLDSVRSPSLSNSSPLSVPKRSVSVIDEFEEIIEELSSPCLKNPIEAKSSPEICDKNTQSPIDYNEAVTISNNSNTALKFPNSVSKDTKTSYDESEQAINAFAMDSVSKDFYLPETEPYVMDDDIFSDSTPNNVDENSPILMGSHDINDACNIPNTSTENSSALSTEETQASLNYTDCGVKILNFQDSLTEHDAYINDWGFDLSSDSNYITNKENSSNISVAATDVSVKEDAQIANKTQNNNGCQLFDETVPNVNVVMTNPTNSKSDSPNSFVPLESLKYSALPAVTSSSSAVKETVCYTEPSTSSAFNNINQPFLSTLLVNEPLVLPQSDFFLNNGSIMIGNGLSVHQDSINVFPNSDANKNFSVANVSEDNSENSQVLNPKKAFNDEEDILSKIVKFCAIGEEFDENFVSPAVSLCNTNVAEPSSLHPAADSNDNESDLNTMLETDSIPNSVEKTTEYLQNSPDCEQSGESTILSCELSNKIDKYQSKENYSSPNQSVDSSQDKDSIQQSVPLDSLIQSIYGEESLYGLNTSGNFDTYPVCQVVQPFDTPLNESTKSRLKSVFEDIHGKYKKCFAIISPSQSGGSPCNGNRSLISETKVIPITNLSSWQSTLNLNDKFITKKTTDPTSNETREVDLNFSEKSDNSTPQCVRIVFWAEKQGEDSPTCSSPESSSSQKSESLQVQPKPFSSENESAQSPSNSASQQVMITSKSKGDHGVLRQLLSKNVTLESTPSVHRPYNKTRILDKILLSPISKDDLLTNDTKRKRKLPFADSPERSESPTSKKIKEVPQRSWKKSLMSDQSRDIAGNLTSSEIDGPTLLNSQDLRSSFEDCARVRHEAQHLTIMSLEIHVNTRNSLNPDPAHDPVTVIFYTIYNEMEEFQQEVVGIIALDQQPENIGLRNTHTSLTNYLNMAPGVKTLKVTCVEDEKLMFDKLVCVVREWDPDVMVGYEIQMASWGYLIERANVLKINLISMLSRLCSEKKETKIDQVVKDQTVTDQTADTDRINIPGRIVLNAWRLLRKEITLNVYTFENVYYHVLRKRTPKYSFHDLTQWYRGKQKGAVVRYYTVRILGTIQILDKLDLIQRTSELARLFGIQFYEVLSRGSQFRVESMMRRTAAQMGFVCVSPSAHQRSHSRAPEFVPLILEPESLLYDSPIIVLDFQSLYPSLIIGYNICFSTCLGRVEHFGKDVPFEFGCTSLSIPLALLKKLLEDDKIHFLPSGIAFVKSEVRRGILPTMLEEILDARVMVKQFMKKIKDKNGLKQLMKQLDAQQKGLKLIANVTYGYTGASFSGRMPCVEVADSIVGKGRETVERAIQLIESKWDAKVVYGDTDSLFVHLPGRTKEEAFKLGQEMADAVTKTNPKPVKLKLEKVYHPCVLQSKKRYVGFMYETIDQKKPVFDAKGIETVRRDSCPATAKILEKSLKILFKTLDVDSAKSYVQNQFLKVMNGRINLMDFIFAKEYRGMSGYRPGACVPALEIAKRNLNKDPRSEPRAGERVPYVVVYGLPGSPIIRLVHEPGDLLKNPSLRINATYYITRVISPPLERVFSLMGANVKTWYSTIAHKQKLNLPMSHYPRETITQYFVTRNCPSCDCPINSSLCDKCFQDRAGTAADLQDKIRKWERAVNHLNQICVSCTKSNSSVDHCMSMDCPVLFKLNLAKKDFSQAPYLRKILTHELF